ncbi:MAG: DUF4432 family protein [Acidimicrobiia bacterium]
MSDLTAAVVDGRLPSLDGVAQVRESVVGATGNRAIDIVPAGGIAIRVLPDRGMDLGQAWFGGTPLAWVSDVGEVGPLDDLSGTRWSQAFGGGLLVTCGLRNVGAPSEGHGLHGTFSHLPATDVRIDTKPDGAVSIRGTILDEASPTLEVSRKIVTHASEGRIEVEDITVNRGETVAVAPLLYHCNFGYPLWTGDARLRTAPVETEPRDDASQDVVGRWGTPMEVAAGEERVLEHRLSSPAAWAQITNSDEGIELNIEWEAATLPWLNQWMDPNPGMAVLGIEPANCRTRGIAFEREQGALPVIQPGEQRHTKLTFTARETAE